ncbi:MAG: division/cell wall cluster transcriptional repressor MraZ [Cardiobacteriaceae bacterium]|nr:division/cell wall cluster transcriptional repressor MraZ [Cardiobacteriaceae bacterium]
MFRGIYHISLDAKGRLSVPAKLRAQFEDESDGVLILTADLENQLLLYTLPEWQKVEEKLVQLPSFDPQIRRLKRLYMGNAAECELDTTGRILIPPPLRQRAGLDKKVVMSGMGNKFEVWSQEAWDEINVQDANELRSDGLDLSGALERLSI